MGEAQRALGENALPVIADVLEERVIPLLTDFGEWVEENEEGIGDFFAGVGTGLELIANTAEVVGGLAGDVLTLANALSALDEEGAEEAGSWERQLSDVSDAILGVGRRLLGAPFEGGGAIGRAFFGGQDGEQQLSGWRDGLVEIEGEIADVGAAYAEAAIPVERVHSSWDEATRVTPTLASRYRDLTGEQRELISFTDEYTAGLQRQAEAAAIAAGGTAGGALLGILPELGTQFTVAAEGADQLGDDLGDLPEDASRATAAVVALDAALQIVQLRQAGVVEAGFGAVIDRIRNEAIAQARELIGEQRELQAEIDNILYFASGDRSSRASAGAGVDGDGVTAGGGPTRGATRAARAATTTARALADLDSQAILAELALRRVDMGAADLANTTDAQLVAALRRAREAEDALERATADVNREYRTRAEVIRDANEAEYQAFLRREELAEEARRAEEVEEARRREGREFEDLDSQAILAELAMRRVNRGAAELARTTDEELVAALERAREAEEALVQATADVNREYRSRAEVLREAAEAERAAAEEREAERRRQAQLAEAMTIGRFRGSPVEAILAGRTAQGTRVDPLDPSTYDPSSLRNVVLQAAQAAREAGQDPLAAARSAYYGGSGVGLDQSLLAGLSVTLELDGERVGQALARRALGSGVAA